MELLFDGNGLTVDEYIAIKNTAGWGPVQAPELCSLALERSLYHVAARDLGRAVAMARLLGDGVFYWHVQDVVVLPEYRGKGIGSALIEHLLAYIREKTPGSATTVGLVAAAGKERFYEKLGFAARPCKGKGAGMDQRLTISMNEEDRL